MIKSLRFVNILNKVRVRGSYLYANDIKKIDDNYNINVTYNSISADNLKNKKIYNHKSSALTKTRKEILKQNLGITFTNKPDKADYIVTKKVKPITHIVLTINDDFISDLTNFINTELSVSAKNGLFDLMYNDLKYRINDDCILLFSESNSDPIIKTLTDFLLEKSEKCIENNLKNVEIVDYYNKGKKLILDHDLLDISDDFQPIIDEEYFNSLINMTEIDDKKLAINLISNCNLKKSIYAVAYLSIERDFYYVEKPDVNLKLLKERLIKKVPFINYSTPLAKEVHLLNDILTNNDKTFVIKYIKDSLKKHILNQVLYKQIKVCDYLFK